MGSRSQRNLIFDTIDRISRLTTVQRLADTFASAVNEFGFLTLGINGLPPGLARRNARGGDRDDRGQQGCLADSAHDVRNQQPVASRVQ
jgi:hypothetical protein